MLTQTSNKEKKKKKQRTNFHHHGLKTHHHWLIQLNQMRKPKHQTMKKKGKKKTEKQTSHHQSLIRCKRCEIPCYYQQIRYINSSNVKNTFGFLWKKLRKRSVVGAWSSALPWHGSAGWLSSDQWNSAWGGKGSENFF